MSLAPLISLFGKRHRRAVLSRPVEVLPPGVVTTERLLIRPLSEADRGEFLRVLRASRSHLCPWFPTNAEGESDEAYFERQAARAADSDQDGSAWRRAAFLADGTLAGVVNVNRIERGLDWQGDACWWVSAELAGRGLGRELVAAAVDHAFADLPVGLGLGRLHAGIHPANEASRRLAERLGFRIDPSRTSRLLVDGSWQTHDAWVLTVVDRVV